MSLDPHGLRGLMGPVAACLMGEPSLPSRTAPRYGTRGSLAIDLLKDTWFDHEQKIGGGVLDFIERETGLTGSDRIAWLKQHGFAKEEHRAGNGTSHPKKSAGRRIVASYDYFDEAGALLMRVVRYEPRDFRQCRPDGVGGWLPNISGVRLVPYRLPALLEAIANDHPVFVVEGEKDVDNLAAIGVVATTNPMGAKKWPESFAEYFHGADVVLVPDNDSPGREHVADVAAKLARVARRIRVLELPGLPAKGDTSDWLAAGGTPEKLYRLAETARPWEPAAEVDPAPNPPPPPAPFIWKLASDLDGKPVPDRSWLVSDIIPARNVTLMSGDGGIGKSTLALQLAAAAASEEWAWLGRITAHGSVLAVLCEDDDDEVHHRLAAITEHMRCRLRELTRLAYSVRVGADNLLMSFDRSHAGKTTPFYEQVGNAAVEQRISLLILDSLHDFFAGDEINRAEARQFIGAMRALAIKADCAVVLLCHPSLAGLASKTGTSGSTGWNNSCRARCYLHRKDEDEEDDDTRVLEVMKSNYGPVAETIDLTWSNGVFVPKAPSFDPFHEADTAFLSCLDKITARGNSYVARGRTSQFFAPRVFARMSEGKRFGEGRLNQAMERLLDFGKIRVGSFRGSNRNRYDCIERAIP